MSELVGELAVIVGLQQSDKTLRCTLFEVMVGIAGKSARIYRCFSTPIDELFAEVQSRNGGKGIEIEVVDISDLDAY